MASTIFALPFFFLIFFIILTFLLIGYTWGSHLNKSVNPEDRADTRVVDGSIFTVMGLLVAFTFSGANIRLDTRRDLVIQEANSILTTYHALSAFPQDFREKEYQYLKQYVNSCIKWSKYFPDTQAMDVEKQRYLQIQKAIWELALNFCKQDHAVSGCSNLFSSLTAMSVMENKRVLYRHIHPPKVIYFMLFCIVLLGALLIGYNIRGKPREVCIHMFAFAIIMSLMLFVILNLEFPRAGLMNHIIFDDFDNALVLLENRFST